MRTGVFVDGFNLFYGLRRFERSGRNYRWLDLLQLAQRLRPNDDIKSIRYFTARLDGRIDPSSPRRQDLYIRALRTIACLEVHEGEFQTGKKSMPLVNPPNGERTLVNVWRTEEKGTDVSLASHLLMDGFQNRYELAIVISNDSDLTEPIQLVRSELELAVGVFNPQSGFSSRLNRVASFYTQINEQAYAGSQFPDVVIDRDGRRITKPEAWNPAHD